MVGKILEFGIKADPLLFPEAENIPMNLVFITHLLIVRRHGSHRGIIIAPGLLGELMKSHHKAHTQYALAERSLPAEL